ncbi:MAG: bifunctional pyr operon transcriptional regulator/uracil phosphoribosyltransferase PyrR [Eubacteriales bacterium]
MSEQTVIMDENSVNRTLSRLAHEILETNPDENTLCLVGIRRRGVPLARRLAESITRFSDVRVILGELDITLYRDDLHEKSEQPHLLSADLGFDVRGKTIVLVDDVIYTGRTVRAAIDALIDAGRPSKIKLCVLVDRGHRELPIRGDYVGKNVPTSAKEMVCVRMPEFDGITEVVILKQPPKEDAAAR